ncbi:energy-coupling factor ABC transporter permease [Blastococcus brunescens]|uniref:Energy-coupling factor ABC transporter permease n=1 Tax=Blastococcus brunescens TaxID=1564165 RepID=A0ABZ1AVI0_9ACTN|nr:energy-coupling factor ABC transporter permease [Blastococcus sp. BMG 8361]WRL62562.1 energy-coupling factor ABC transporter permease [Blastococcus sp. BMG 8361]
MHVPDGFLDAPTSVATGVLAAGAVAVALRKAREELDDRTAPMAGLTAAFVFAVQMVNFPVAAGTSGHLIGGALTALLVGPWTAVLSMTVVLLVQAVLFADGGLTALGTNVTLLGVVAVVVGYGIVRALTAVLPRTRTSLLGAAGIGAFLSVPVAALAFVGLFGLGGVADVPLGTVAGAMTGVHLLIGLGEAAITVAVLGAVLAARPDLVHAAGHLRKDAALDRRPGLQPAGPPDEPPSLVLGRRHRGDPAGRGRPERLRQLLPDGLERAAEDAGFGHTAEDSAVAGSPLADYALGGQDGALSGGAAGVIGVVVTLVLAGAWRWWSVAADVPPPRSATDVAAAPAGP